MKLAEARAVERSLVLSVSFLVLLGGLALPSRSQDTNLMFYPVQVLNTYQNRVCQHVYDPATQNYRLAWQSEPLDFYRSPTVRMGDIDNDTQMEVVACGYYLRIEGTKRNQVVYYSYGIQVFEEGAAYESGPSWEVRLTDELQNNLLRDSWIADVDPLSPGNELVFMRSHVLSIYHFAAQGAFPTCRHTQSFSASLDSIDVGDADNDTRNEILVDSGQRPWIIGHDDGAWTLACAPVDAVPLGDADVLNLTHVRIRDVDRDGRNEVISTGTNERLIVWRWQNGAYEYITVGPDLIGNMAYGLDCGNVNGDKTAEGNDIDEVVIDVWSIRTGRIRLPSRVVVLAHDAGSYVIENTFSSDLRWTLDLRVADLTGDGHAEVVLNDDNYDLSTLRILTFEGEDLRAGSFKQVYTTPTDPYVRIEIGKK